MTDRYLPPHDDGAPLESLDDKPIEEVVRIAIDTINRMRKDMPWHHRLRLLPTSILAQRAIRKLERRNAAKTRPRPHLRIGRLMVFLVVGPLWWGQHKGDRAYILSVGRIAISWTHK